MDKEIIKRYIHEIFEFIDSGELEFHGDTFYGHPGFYFFHSKEELNKKIDSLLTKETYDKYDLYYIVNCLIKYMLEKYDSHTKVNFDKNITMPIKFKIQDGIVYVINHSEEIENCKGAKVVAVNNIPIDKLLEELENMISYSTKEYLEVIQEVNLCNFEILKSLPSINNNSDVITFQVLFNGKITEIKFQKDTFPKPILEEKIENYSYEIYDNSIVIHYHECRSKHDNQMIQLINQLNLVSEEENIDNYIVDLRDNMGGDSRIINPLVEYLSNKNVVVLVNEKVFSSGRMAYVNLKRIGAYSIGTDISTSLNCFGNIPGQLRIKDFNLIVRRSSTYWLYDNNFNCKGYRKGEFEKFFTSRKELLEPMILHPDEKVVLSIDDIINGNDPQLMAAINYFKHQKKMK